MAITFDEVDDRYTIADDAGLTLPASDWAIGFWAKVDDSTGSLFQYAFSNNGYGAANSINIWLLEASEPSADKNKWGFRLEDGSANDTGIVLSSTAPGGDGAWRLIILQRDTTAGEFQLWFCEANGSASKVGSISDTGYGTINGGAWYLGCRSDLNADRFFGGTMAEFFAGGFALSSAEMATLATVTTPSTPYELGDNILSLGKTPTVYFNMLTAEATLEDASGNGHDATRTSAPATATHPIDRYKINIAATQVAVNTSTGNQTITATKLYGQTPKAALFIISRATTNGTAVSTAALGVGATDGVSEWAQTALSADGVGTSFTRRGHTLSACVTLLGLAGTYEAEATFASFGAGSVTINWSTAPASGRLLTVVLLAGTELYIDFGTYQMPLTVNASVAVNTGFNPDVVILNSSLLSFTSAITRFSQLGYGAVTNTAQRSVLFRDDDLLSTVEILGHYSENYGIAWTDGAIVSGSEVDLTMTGFTSTTRLNPPNQAFYIGYLALGLPDGYSADLRTITAHDAATTIDIATGQRGLFTLFGMSTLDTVDTLDTSGKAGAIGLGVATAPIGETSPDVYSAAYMSEDGVATSNAESLADDSLLINQDDGTAGFSSTVAFGATDGYLLGWGASSIGYDANWWALHIGMDYTAPPAADLIPATYEIGDLRVDILDASGNLVGEGPLVTVMDLQRERELSRIGGVKFPVPATDPRTEYLTAGRHYKLYHTTHGYLGEYLHRSLSVRSGDRPMLTVEADDLLRELARLSTLFNRNYNNQYLGAIVSDLLTLASGWSGGSVANVGYTTAEFQGESLLSAIVNLAKGGGAHFRLNGSRVLDFGEFGTASGVRAMLPPDLGAETATGASEICYIDSVSVAEEGGGIVNRIIALGAGQGESQLSLRWVQNENASYPVQNGTNPDGSTYYYIQDLPSQASYGVVEKLYKRSDIRPISNSVGDLQNAADALYNAALATLLAHKDPQVSYKLTVRELDTTSLLPGDTLRVFYRGVVTLDGSPYRWLNIDRDMVVLSITDEFDEKGNIRHSLEVSANGIRPVSDAGLVSEMHRDLQVVRGNIQPGITYNKVGPFEEEIAPSFDVALPVRIGAECLFLNHAKLRFTTRPLRATVKGSEAGGGSTATSASTAAHSHDGVVFNRILVSALNDNHKAVYIHRDDGEVVFPSNDAGPSTHTKTTTAENSHSHNVTIPAHSHALDYGIYDDSNYPQNIEVWINGTDRTTALGGPWAATNAAVDVEVDIAEYFKDANGDLLQQNHEVVFKVSGGTDNQGVITAEIDMMLTIQSIAVA